jgi:kinesin family protein 20
MCILKIPPIHPFLYKYCKNEFFFPHQVRSISFYDLAGICKVQKSVSTSKQLQESRSINTSLLAFGKCLQAIAETRLRQSIGPFRDSKLTRLFQHSFCNKENIILLINVNPTPELFAETQSVLKFASTAMKLTLEFSKEDKSFIDNQAPISAQKVQELHTSTSRKTLHDQQIEDIISKNKQLLVEIKELKSCSLQKESEIRQELTDFYTKQLNDLEEFWKHRMTLMEEEKNKSLNLSICRVKNYYKSKLDKCMMSKRKKIDRGDYEEYLDGQVVQTKNSFLPLNNVSHEDSLKSLNDVIKSITMEKNDYISKLLLLKQRLKALAESNNDSNEKSLISLNRPDSSDIEKIELHDAYDNDVLSYLSVIEEVITKFHKMQKFNEHCRDIQNISRNTAVQCNIESKIFNKCFKEIQELLVRYKITLPCVNDSLKLSESNQDNDISQQTVNLLFQVKELIDASIAKEIELEMENNENSEELKVLKIKVQQQERDILQMKIQYQESESIRLALEKTIKDYEIKSTSKEFMKNLDFSTINLQNLYLDAFSEPIADKQLSLEYSCDKNLEQYLFELESERNNCSIRELSCDNSKNDSGLASCLEYPMKQVNDQICQTDFVHVQDTNEFNFDFKVVKKSQQQEDYIKITKLTEELENLRTQMAKLEENYFKKEEILTEYEYKNDSNKIVMERLNHENDQLEIKCHELTNNLRKVKRECKKKLNESEVRQ